MHFLLLAMHLLLLEDILGTFLQCAVRKAMPHTHNYSVCRVYRSPQEHDFFAGFDWNAMKATELVVYCCL